LKFREYANFFRFLLYLETDHLHVEHMSIASLETQHPILELTTDQI
jgi:hypothetical protein